MPTSTGSQKKQENFRKISTSALLTTPKPLTVCITTNCGKFLKEWEYQTTLPASWETCMPVKEQHLEQDMEQWTDSKSGKEYIEAICCHPAYVIYMQSVVLVTQSCPTLCNPMDCSPPGSSVHGILQARILEWAAISFCIIGRSTSCEMSGWMKHKLESSKIAGRNIWGYWYFSRQTCRGQIKCKKFMQFNEILPVN